MHFPPSPKTWETRLLENYAYFLYTVANQKINYGCQGVWKLVKKTFRPTFTIETAKIRFVFVITRKLEDFFWNFIFPWKSPWQHAFFKKTISKIVRAVFEKQLFEVGYLGKNVVFRKYLVRVTFSHIWSISENCRARPGAQFSYITFTNPFTW